MKPRLLLQVSERPTSCSYAHLSVHPIHWIQPRAPNSRRQTTKTTERPAFFVRLVCLGKRPRTSLSGASPPVLLILDTCCPSSLLPSALGHQTLDPSIPSPMLMLSDCRSPFCRLTEPKPDDLLTLEGSAPEPSLASSLNFRAAKN